MSVAALDGGIQAIKRDPRWADLVFYEYAEAYDREPTAEEVREPEAQIYKKSLFTLLRQVHAENAERLAFLSYPASDRSPMFLIEDAELRQTYGQVIGRIAHSHWWSVAEVERTFSRIIGAPHWCPPDWTVDPLKIACLLRVADAAHLDARRAPGFLKAISHLSPKSEAHWRFQEKLNKPYLREDSLVFTSGSSFQFSDAGAWWLCLETLKTVDAELRTVDALFADRRAPRFAARGVAGVDNPERLSAFIQTDGWLPINAMIHVSDLPHVITSVGGEELYGRHPEVALRELVQNGCDAVRARRFYERRASDFGRVIVSLSQADDGSYWLQVDDSGTGMSQRVLTDFLLNFGRSFWGSAEMQEEFPGLLSSGVKSTGKYGIGFFSVFMVAHHVCVITRRCDAGAKETLVLEFSNGVEGRPILRAAERSEQLIDGGTSVRLRLKKHPMERGGLLYQQYGDKQLSLEDLCRRTCPAIDVDLYVQKNGTTDKIIAAEDWKTLNAVDLLNRLEPSLDSPNEEHSARIEDLRSRLAPNLRFVYDDDGKPVGRACLTVGIGRQYKRSSFLGALTVGGLKAVDMFGIVGILAGKSLRASRDSAKPLATNFALARWAEEQVDILPAIESASETLVECAHIVRQLGGRTKNLPVAYHKGSWLSAEQISAMAPSLEVAFIASDYEINLLEHVDSYELEDGVFFADQSVRTIMRARHDAWLWTRVANESWQHSWMRVTLQGAVLEALCVGWGVPVESVYSEHLLDEREEVAIAHAGQRVIRATGHKIVRPK